MSVGVTAAAELLERQPLLDRLVAALEQARAGEGLVLGIQGEAGIGKTALLGALRRRATAAGCTVLSARGGELERDYAHGVARQLYEPLLHGAGDDEREALLAGAARLAGLVLDLPPATAPAREKPVTDPNFAANHGLYWLTANIAEIRPVVLVVDDAHWVDAASLSFLTYLGRRLEGLPVLVGLALRTGQPQAPQELLDALLGLPAADTLVPAALSTDASGELVERKFGRAADRAFREACHEVTGGNPFLLGELLHALISDGVAPHAEVAERVRRLAPRSIARSVLGRLAAMSSDARALAQAVAVLDTDADFRHAAALAQLDLPAAEAAADGLTAAHILGHGRPLRFAHPVMRAAVYEDLPHARRSADHARVARLLDSEGGDPDRAAVHLLAAEPVADPWALDRLRAAAARAVDRGAPRAAMVLLRRALVEPPAREQRAATLVELGRASRLAGDSSAVEHLRVALEEATDPALRVAAARELAAALALGAQLEAAVDVLERAVARAPDRETALIIEAQLFGLSQASDPLAARIAPRLERACEGLSGETAGERLALAANVFHRTFACRGTSEEIVALARRALGEGRLLAEATGDHFAFYGPLIALRDSDRHDEARAALEAALADARSRGSAAAVAATLGTLALLEHQQGRLAHAEAAARSAMEAAESSAHFRLFLPLAMCTVVLALVERGALDEADALLEGYGLATASPLATSTTNPFLAARTRLHLGQGRVAEAVADTTTWLERQRARGGLNAVGASSIINPALPFLAAGAHATAHALAVEILAVARRWGVAGYEGSCRLALGLVTGGSDGIEQLHAGVALLERSSRRLELARGLVELGAALRRANRRADARERLRRGMELAHRCGASQLAERARAELRATGARPRRLVVSGADALTAQERRIAEMAADGLSNPEIAQALFITRRTVETHLRHSYQKLEISTREALREALDGEP